MRGGPDGEVVVDDIEDLRVVEAWEVVQKVWRDSRRDDAVVWSVEKSVFTIWRMCSAGFV